MAQLTVTVDFTISDAPRNAERLTKIFGKAKELSFGFDLSVDLEYDEENLRLVVDGKPEGIRALLESLAPEDAGNLLVELFGVDERRRFGDLNGLHRLSLEVVTWELRHPKGEGLKTVTWPIPHGGEPREII